MNKNNFFLTIDNFEGPLDLLLHLIKNKRMNIFDLDISSLIIEYTTYIDMHKNISLDVASEYLLMLTYLIELKSRLLLPDQKNDDDSEYVDPREELISQLLEYKKYKEASIELRNIKQGKGLFYLKNQEDLSTYIKQNNFELNEKFVADDILKTFTKIMSRIHFSKTKKASLELFEISIEDVYEEVTNKLSKIRETKLSNLFKNSRNKQEVVSIFMCVLEMIRENKITFIQDNLFEDITIIRLGE